MYTNLDIEKLEQVRVAELVATVSVPDELLNCLYGSLMSATEEHGAATAWLRTGGQLELYSGTEAAEEPLRGLSSLLLSNPYSPRTPGITDLFANLHPLGQASIVPSWHTHEGTDGFTIATIVGTIGLSGTMKVVPGISPVTMLAEAPRDAQLDKCIDVKPVPSPANRAIYIPPFAIHRSPSFNELQNHANSESHRLMVSAAMMPRP